MKIKYKHLFIFVILLVTMQLFGCTKPTEIEQRESVVNTASLKTNSERMLNNRKNKNEYYAKSGHAKHLLLAE